MTVMSLTTVATLTIATNRDDRDRPSRPWPILTIATTMTGLGREANKPKQPPKSTGYRAGSLYPVRLSPKEDGRVWRGSELSTAFGQS